MLLINLSANPRQFAASVNVVVRFILSMGGKLGKSGDADAPEAVTIIRSGMANNIIRLLKASSVR